jgi:hypothetical protein
MTSLYSSLFTRLGRDSECLRRFLSRALVSFSLASAAADNRLALWSVLLSSDAVCGLRDPCVCDFRFLCCLLPDESRGRLCRDDSLFGIISYYCRAHSTVLFLAAAAHLRFFKGLKLQHSYACRECLGIDGG